MPVYFTCRGTPGARERLRQAANDGGGNPASAVPDRAALDRSRDRFDGRQRCRSRGLRRGDAAEPCKVTVAAQECADDAATGELLVLLEECAQHILVDERR